MAKPVSEHKKIVSIDKVIGGVADGKDLNWRKGATGTPTDPASTADPILICFADVSPTYERPFDLIERRTPGKHSHLLYHKAGETGRIAFETELNFAELVSTIAQGQYLPAIVPLLKACGYEGVAAETAENASNQLTKMQLKVNDPIVASEGITTSSQLKLRGYVDDDQYFLISGAVGTVKFTLPAGGIAKAAFEFMGAADGLPPASAPPYTSGVLTPNFEKSENHPFLVQGVTFNPALPADIEAEIKEVVIDLASSLTRRPDPTAATGFSGYRIADINTVVTLKFEINDPEKWDTFQTNIGSETANPFTFGVRMASGVNNRFGSTPKWNVPLELTIDLQYAGSETTTEDGVQYFILTLKPAAGYIAPLVHFGTTANLITWS